MYALFGGQCYYATGGYNDFLGKFESMQEAVRIGNLYMDEGYVGPYDDDDWYEHRQDGVEWWHVVDLSTCKIVANTEYQAYGVGKIEE